MTVTKNEMANIKKDILAMLGRISLDAKDFTTIQLSEANIVGGELETQINKLVDISDATSKLVEQVAIAQFDKAGINEIIQMLETLSAKIMDHNAFLDFCSKRSFSGFGRVDGKILLVITDLNKLNGIYPISIQLGNSVIYDAPKLTASKPLTFDELKAKLFSLLRDLAQNPAFTSIYSDDIPVMNKYGDLLNNEVKSSLDISVTTEEIFSLELMDFLNVVKGKLELLKDIGDEKLTNAFEDCELYTLHLENFISEMQHYSHM